MSRDYSLYLNDILESIDRIQRYTHGMSYEDFRDNDLVQDAVIRNLMVIGEAVKLIPEPLKQKNPEISWRKRARQYLHPPEEHSRESPSSQLNLTGMTDLLPGLLIIPKNSSSYLLHRQFQPLSLPDEWPPSYTEPCIHFLHRHGGHPSDFHH